MNVKAVGNLYLLPYGITRVLKNINDASGAYYGIDLNLAIAYGEHIEMVDVYKKEANMVKDGGVDIS